MASLPDTAISLFQCWQSLTLPDTLVISSYLSPACHHTITVSSTAQKRYTCCPQYTARHYTIIFSLMLERLQTRAVHSMLSPTLLFLYYSYVKKYTHTRPVLQYLCSHTFPNVVVLQFPPLSHLLFGRLQVSSEPARLSPMLLLPLLEAATLLSYPQELCKHALSLPPSRIPDDAEGEREKEQDEGGGGGGKRR